MNFNDRITRQLDLRRADQSFRKLSVSEDLVDFSSNDYLGLARSSELREFIDRKRLPANGATGSRLLSGNSAYTEEVESKLADLFQSQKVLIFNSGYTANLAVLSTLPQRGDTILYDELSHACIKDGARLSLAKRYSFKHNNLADLEHKLKAAQGNIFISVESVYSMDGDFCPLEALVDLASRYDAHIILDEAHTTGILGAGGSGLSGALGLQSKILIRTYTFGKAMGVHGAAVACNTILADYLINFARPFIYTTALSPHSITSIEAAFNYLGDHEILQETLRKKVIFFNEAFNQLIGSKLTKGSAVHPIQAIVIPGNESAIKASQHLKRCGFDVRPILSPTVKSGEERLRICLHTFNSDKDISGLVDSFAAVL